MTTRTRRLAALTAAAAALGAGAAPAALAADHVNRLDIGAELVRQQPGGKPWVVNLLLGAEMGMTDGTIPKPVTNMKFSFTAGAKVHPEAFKVCTADALRKAGPGACPKGSKLGSGTANANALDTDFPADVTVFNGPGKGSTRKLLVYARAIQTVTIVLEGTLRKTSGRYGYVLDLPVPPINTVGGAENDAAITNFNVKVGGYGRVHGKRVPFVEAPTACHAPGWPFQARFTYVDGTTGSSSARIGCTLKAVNS
jgi:hypothetical protein